MNQNQPPEQYSVFSLHGDVKGIKNIIIIYMFKLKNIIFLFVFVWNDFYICITNFKFKVTVNIIKNHYVYFKKLSKFRNANL